MTKNTHNQLTSDTAHYYSGVYRPCDKQKEIELMLVQLPLESALFNWNPQKKTQNKKYSTFFYIFLM